MVDRVPSSRTPGSESSHAPHAAGPPPESPTFQQAAAEFAALLGTDLPANQSPQTRKPESRSDAREPDDTSPPTKRDEGGHERVGEKKHQQGKSGEGDSQENPGSEEPPQVVSLGDAILQAFSKGDVATVPAADPARSANLDQIVQQVADKILISDPSSGMREVRITLKDSILQGTEVRITQEAGKLQVQFVTTSPRSQELLAQNQAALQDRLGVKLNKQDVVVQVEFDPQGQGESQDGRSRQQRKLDEEMDKVT